MREAPSEVIIKKLLNEGTNVRAYDPVAVESARKIFGNSVAFFDDQYEALTDADCLALITEWPEFRFPKLDVIKNLLKSPVVFDGRNIYERSEMKRNGFTYYCIGIDTLK